MPANVELRPGTLEDEWLTVALETDPRVMAELGSAWTEEQARATHRRRIAGATEHGWWWLVIVPGPGRQPIGSIGLWASEWEGGPISETGWMVLPEHQGKGYATAALATLLERVRDDPRWGDIHAFPGSTNAPSNALCRKFGFELLDEVTVEYADRPLTCNRWVLRARHAPAS